MGDSQSIPPLYGHRQAYRFVRVNGPNCRRGRNLCDFHCFGGTDSREGAPRPIASNIWCEKLVAPWTGNDDLSALGNVSLLSPGVKSVQPASL
jgi:hypothetical protein